MAKAGDDESILPELRKWKSVLADVLRQNDLERRHGRDEEAKKLYQQSLELNRRMGNVAGEIVTLLNLAMLDYDAGKREAARAAYVLALTQARLIRSVETEAEILDKLAQADFLEGDFVQARGRWTEAKALFEKLKAAPRVTDMADLPTQLSATEKAADVWKTHETLLTGGGVVVTAVLRDGQAAKAGLEAGDILIRHGKIRLDKPETLQTTAKAADPQKTFSLEVLRGAKKLTVQVHGGSLDVFHGPLPPKPQPKPPASTTTPSGSANPSAVPAPSVPASTATTTQAPAPAPQP